MLQTLAAIGLPFVPGWETLRPFAPELWLIATIVAVLFTPFFTRKSNFACAGVALVGLVLALVATFVVGEGSGVVGQHLRGMLVLDPLAVFWKGMLLMFTIGIVLMWGVTTAWTMREGDAAEFFTLLLGATLGLSLMTQTTNLLMLVMGLELASFASYVLAGFRKTERVGAEASLKYVIFGAAASSVMIYGLSLLYGIAGSLQFEVVADHLAREGVGALGAVALACVVVGIAFKVSAVPVHLWCPDVFEGASVEVSAFLSVASKGAALILFLRLATLLAESMQYTGTALTTIAAVIGVLGVLTATVGNTSAFVQTNVKRLLAYSSIAQAGYMLCVLSLLVKHRSDVVTSAGAGLVLPEAAGALLFYLAAYLFMNLGAFTVAAVVEAGGGKTLDDLAGLGTRSPVLAASMTASMFSLVGLPPFAGFVAKINLMYVLGANGGWWWTLVVAIGVNTILSLYYYVKVVRVMYFEPTKTPAARPNLLGGALALACAAVMVTMLVGFGPLRDLTSHFGQVHVEEREAVAMEE
jgi:NADH-quinone oxidoreductase subunit N